jgi:hypothetical protein
MFDRITLGLMAEDEIPVTMQKKWAATSKIPGGWVVFVKWMEKYKEELKWQDSIWCFRISSIR